MSELKDNFEFISKEIQKYGIFIGIVVLMIFLAKKSKFLIIIPILFSYFFSTLNDIFNWGLNIDSTNLAFSWLFIAYILSIIFKEKKEC